MTALIIIACYLVVLLGLGLGSSRLFRGTSLDYLLASHSIGPFLLLMSLFGTTMTGFSLVGSTGEAYVRGIGVYGLLASSSAIIHPMCFFLIGLPLWSHGNRHGFTTQIQFFEARLESQHFGLLLFPVLVGLVVPYLLVGIIPAGGAINGVTRGLFETAFADAGHGVPPWLGSLVICLVVLTYVFAGGMRGTAWANAFQTLVFLLLGVITFLVVVKGMGQQPGLLASMQAATEKVEPQKLDRSSFSHLNWSTYLLVPLSIGMFPHIFQHWLTARNANAFKLPIIAHPLFILVVWAPCVMLGTWASGQGLDLPPQKANLVLPVLVSQHAGPVLGGLLTAGILAAIMSSLDSQFLCLGTMFTRDIVQRHAAASELDDRQTVFLARSFIVAIVAVAYVLSLVLNSPRIFKLGVWCFSGFTSLVPLVLAALYWKRLTLPGAYASVAAAALTWGYLLWQSDFASNAHYSVMVGNVAVDPILVMTLAAAMAMVAVSLITRPPSHQTLAKFFPGLQAE
ncbi:sodium:solute symporter family protein [bacterium]|nr:sodium:solute symporter family protein [bacterium]